MRSASACFAAACEYLGPRLPPKHLRQRIVARAEHRGPAGPSVGLLKAVERVERLGQGRRPVTSPCARAVGLQGKVAAAAGRLQGKLQPLKASFLPVSFRQPPSNSTPHFGLKWRKRLSGRSDSPRSALVIVASASRNERSHAARGNAERSGTLAESRTGDADAVVVRPPRFTREHNGPPRHAGGLLAQAEIALGSGSRA